MSPGSGNTHADACGAPVRITRRQFVTGMSAVGALLAAGGHTACGGGAAAVHSFTPTPMPLNSSSAIKEVANAKALLFGAAAARGTLQSDPDFAAAVARHAAVIVPENELKWETVEPQPGNFNFEPGDWLADYAAQHEILFRGHCLVWHQQIPPWAGKSASSAADQLTSHISETVRHYAGRIHSWDVVNEAIDPSDGRSDALRNTLWLRALGPGYIDLAFRSAAAADPNAMLVYNDYGLEYDTGDAAARRAGVLRLLQSLKSSGTPVHALGIQAHLAGSAPPNFTKLPAFLKAVADLGLSIFITEMDVSDQGLPLDVDTRDGVVANVYQRFLDTVLAQPAVKAVITWGLSDRYTWLSRYAPRSDGQPVRPLPLDRSLRPKTAVWAMMDAFNATTNRNLS